MAWSTLFSIVVAILVYLLLRLLYVIFVQVPVERPGSVIVVLGSGGHTTEMLRWLELVREKAPASSLRRIIFVSSATDTHSTQAAVKFDSSAPVKYIPRAREVGQSYFSSVFTTLHAIVSSLRIVYNAAPATIATNGPGVCIPIVAANLILCALLPFSLHPKARLLYVESFACVQHLSLSGRILLRIAQKFLVQWPGLYRQLQSDRRRSKNKNNNSSSNNVEDAVVGYSGAFKLHETAEAEAAEIQQRKQHADANKRLSFRPLRDVGNNSGDASNKTTPSAATCTCLVTVGSTKFDKLIAAVDTDAFEAALLRLGITDLLVQKGATTLTLRKDSERGGEGNQKRLRRTVVDYKHGLSADIASAALVISHAGAGTILEAMAARVATVVVPNTQLMANHQIELAEGLGSRGHLLFCPEPEQLVALLNRKDIDWKSDFVPLPPPNADEFYRQAGSFFRARND